MIKARLCSKKDSAIVPDALVNFTKPLLPDSVEREALDQARGTAGRDLLIQLRLICTKKDLMPRHSTTRCDCTHWPGFRRRSDYRVGTKGHRPLPAVHVLASEAEKGLNFSRWTDTARNESWNRNRSSLYKQAAADPRDGELRGGSPRSLGAALSQDAGQSSELQRAH